VSRSGSSSARGVATGILVRMITAVAVLLMFVLLATPFLALVLRASPSRLVSRLGDPAVLEALRLSLLTSAIATAIVVATGRGNGRWKCSWTCPWCCHPRWRASRC